MWKRRLGHLELVFLVYLALFSSDFPPLFIRTAQAFPICSVAIPINFSLFFCVGLFSTHLLWLLGGASWELWKDHTPGHCFNQLTNPIPGTLELSFKREESNSLGDLVLLGPQNPTRAPRVENTQPGEDKPHLTGSLAG